MHLQKAEILAGISKKMKFSFFPNWSMSTAEGEKCQMLASSG